MASEELFTQVDVKATARLMVLGTVADNLFAEMDAVGQTLRERRLRLLEDKVVSRAQRDASWARPSPQSWEERAARLLRHGLQARGSFRGKPPPLMSGISVHALRSR